jgi:hypothetical protein
MFLWRRIKREITRLYGAQHLDTLLNFAKAEETVSIFVEPGQEHLSTPALA